MKKNVYAGKVITAMMVVIRHTFDKWTETIGPRLEMVGSSFYDEGIKKIPEKFCSPETTEYTSDDVYELHSYFLDTMLGGIELADRYYNTLNYNQMLEKEEILTSIRLSMDNIDDIMKSPMMKMVAERRAAVAGEHHIH